MDFWGEGCFEEVQKLWLPLVAADYRIYDPLLFWSAFRREIFMFSKVSRQPSSMQNCSVQNCEGDALVV